MALLVIDPGHGGKYPGVVRESDGFREADATLATALTLKWLLKRLGAPFSIMLTRTEDKTIPFSARVVPATLSISIHYDIPNGAKPIYHQKGRETSYYVAERLRLLTERQHPVWSTEAAAHTGGRLYIDDAKHEMVLLEVDTIDNYQDDRDYRIEKMLPVAGALMVIMDEIKDGF